MPVIHVSGFRKTCGSTVAVDDVSFDVNAGGGGHEREQAEVMDVGRVSVWTLSPGTAFFYIGGMAIDADGAPTAYHPNGTSGLDALGNAGRPGNWWALVTDTGTSAGTPVIQGAADPAPGFYVSTTSLHDAARK